MANLGNPESLRGSHRGALFCVPTALARLANCTYSEACESINREKFGISNGPRITGVGQEIWGPILAKAGFVQTYKDTASRKYKAVQGWGHTTFRRVRDPSYKTVTLNHLANADSVRADGKIRFIRTPGHVLLLRNGLIYDNNKYGVSPIGLRRYGKCRVEGVWEQP